jgi:phosphoribosylaminoimidazole-succinocarboxamide synthase
MAIHLEPVYSGKVRDLYAVGDDLLLMVASDRVSAFDVVMAEVVPDKGRVLTALSAFWFDRFAAAWPSHLVSTDIDEVDGVDGADAEHFRGRVMLCRRAEMLPIECIVRGRLSGSAWREYRQYGTVHGMAAPAGLVESAPLTEPLFTPSTKAAVGGHDENISFDQAVDLIGVELAEEARSLSLELFNQAATVAEQSGVVIADTKFELGLIDGRLAVCDEVLTPDSSRFWPADDCAPGSTPPSFDKQPLRDYLDGLDWDKQPPPPALPDSVTAALRRRYVEAYERITGRDFAEWPGVSG